MGVEVEIAPADLKALAKFTHDPAMIRPMFTIRPATREDVPAIEHVMRRSLETIGRTAYDDTQVESSLQFIASPDLMLIDDGTYYVAVANDGTVVGCGGWSRRAKLYRGSGERDEDARPLDPDSEPARVRAMFVDPAWARRGIGRAILEASENAAREAGFRRVELMAMLSGGEALYEVCGYEALERTHIDFPDGVKLGTTRMSKAL